MKTTKMNNWIYGSAVRSGQHHDCQVEVARVLPVSLREVFRTKFATLWERRPHLLHLAITEAAALAERTGFPQLFLPALALEKAEAAAAWHLRQQHTFLGKAGFRTGQGRY
jgi:hypothetical protein